MTKLIHGQVVELHEVKPGLLVSNLDDYEAYLQRKAVKDEWLKRLGRVACTHIPSDYKIGIDPDYTPVRWAARKH